jgi:transposase
MRWIPLLPNCLNCKHASITGEKATEFYSFGETLVLRHLPICEREVYLHLRPKWYRCLRCDDHPTTAEQCDWYDAKSGCTKAYADFLLRELVNSTMSDVAIKHLVPYDVVRGLVRRYIKGEVDWSQFKDLRVLGLDEISLLKGHRDFVTIVSTRDDRGRPVVLAVLEGREKETVVAFLRSIPEHVRSTIEQVCTDLYDGYVNSAKEVLPHAKVVADRFQLPNFTALGSMNSARSRCVSLNESSSRKSMPDSQECCGLYAAIAIS